jgi:hypothetical protein
MSLFSSNEVIRVGEIFGYFPGQVECDQVKIPLSQIAYHDSKTTILGLIADIKEIEKEIENLHKRVLTKQVDEITLNARTAIREYERLGTKKLERLSQITGIAIRYNLFKPSCSYSKLNLP